MTEPTKRPRGRPEVGPMLRGLRVEASMLEQIEAIAQTEQISRAEVVRELLAEALTARADNS